MKIKSCIGIKQNCGFMKSFAYNFACFIQYPLEKEKVKVDKEGLL